MVAIIQPGGSIKDRAAWALIKDAEEKKLISKGGTIVEGTSGNTGMGLALAAKLFWNSCSKWSGNIID